MNSIKVWDIPTRLFHWLLVLTLITCYLSGTYKSDYYELAEVHFWSGYCVLFLIIFRVIWGVAGATYSRFSHFKLKPKHLIAFLKGKEEPAPGHTTAGSLMTIALLTLISAQAVTGLFSFDNGLYLGGPFSEQISSTLSKELTTLHHQIFDLLLVFVLLHIAAILIYALKGKNYASAMLTGKKSTLLTGKAADYTSSGKLIFIIAILASIGLVYVVVFQLPAPPSYY